jgi:hypothetical protein
MACMKHSAPILRSEFEIPVARPVRNDADDLGELQLGVESVEFAPAGPSALSRIEGRSIGQRGEDAGAEALRLAALKDAREHVAKRRLATAAQRPEVRAAARGVQHAGTSVAVEPLDKSGAAGTVAGACSKLGRTRRAQTLLARRSGRASVGERRIGKLVGEGAGVQRARRDTVLRATAEGADELPHDRSPPDGTEA